MGLLDKIEATPRNKLLGLLADAAQGANEFASAPFGYQNPPGKLLMGLLGVPAVAKTLDELSYGNTGALVSGKGMTLRPKDDTVDAVMAVAPFVPKAAQLANTATATVGKAVAPAVERAVPRIMARGGFPAQLLQDMSRKTASPLTVWHGSPHKFDKFDSSKIGTGEGAQAYGHGIYVAESSRVAEGYKNALSPGAGIGDADTIARAIKSNGGDLNKAADDLAMRAQYANIPGGKEKLLSLSDMVRNGYDPRGSLYKIDLPDEHIAKMLDWDKPLSQQAQAVQDALSKLNDPLIETWKNNGFWEHAPKGGASVYSRLSNGITKGNVEGGLTASASDQLRKAGIPGIRYLDGGSRGTGAGTSNFVIFPGNEGMLTILERNGKPIGLLGSQ